MPIYEFYCDNCNITIEKLQKVGEPCPLCDMCGNKLKKIVSNSFFVLKGEGWSKDGYSKKKAVKKENTKTKPKKDVAK